MKDKRDLIHLLWINDRFGHVTNSDPYLARQIRDAIDASLEPKANSDEAAYGVALDRLSQTFGPSPEAGRFTWIDAREDPGFRGLLWLRAAVMQHLKTLARKEQATLLIANLPDLFRPPGKRWTAGRRQAYGDTVQWLRDLVRARSLPHRPINLLLL